MNYIKREETLEEKAKQSLKDFWDYEESFNTYNPAIVEEMSRAWNRDKLLDECGWDPTLGPTC
jgi:hypothetical protein